MGAIFTRNDFMIYCLQDRQLPFPIIIHLYGKDDTNSESIFHHTFSYRLTVLSFHTSFFVDNFILFIYYFMQVMLRISLLISKLFVWLHIITVESNEGVFLSAAFISFHRSLLVRLVHAQYKWFFSNAKMTQEIVDYGPSANQSRFLITYTSNTFHHTFIYIRSKPIQYYQ